MPSRIFRFYSLEPSEIFRMAGDRWPSAIVRRSGRKVGGSPIFNVTVVLDDFRAAEEFGQWLVQNAPQRNIRRHVGRADRGAAGAVYEDVLFHGGGLASRWNFPIVTFRREIGRYWLDVRRSALRVWLRFRS